MIEHDALCLQRRDAGIIETEMTRQYFENPDFLGFYPLGFGRPEDVAEAVDF